MESIIHFKGWKWANKIKKNENLPLVMNLSILIITIWIEITHSALSFQMVVFVLLIYTLQAKCYTGNKSQRAFLYSLWWVKTDFFTTQLGQNPYSPKSANQLAAASFMHSACHIIHHGHGFCSCPFPSSKSILRSICTQYCFLQTLCFQ